MLIVLDLISLLAILVLWFATVLYIVVIRKYQYDEYEYHWDSFKMWYSLSLIVFIGISVWRSVCLFQVSKIYSIVSIALLIIIFCFLSLFYIFRIVIYHYENPSKKKKGKKITKKMKKRNKYRNKDLKSDTPKITLDLLKKVVLATSVSVIIYFLFTWTAWSGMSIF